MPCDVAEIIGPEKTLALPAYRGHIEDALVYADATHTYDDVVSMVAAGRAQFWPGPASCIVTEIIDYPRKRVLNLFLAGGTLAELEAMLPFVLDWGRSQGCQSAAFIGRRGWLRSFATTAGFREAPLTLMEKSLV